MKSFTDIKGRAWEIVVTVATVKRVRALCKVDLNSIVELDKNNKPSAELLERRKNVRPVRCGKVVGCCMRSSHGNSHFSCHWIRMIPSHTRKVLMHRKRTCWPACDERKEFSGCPARVHFTSCASRTGQFIETISVSYGLHPILQ